MKQKYLITLALLLCVIAGFAAAIAGINGKWMGTLKTADGSEFPLTYVLKADGDKLTGTGLAPQGTVELTKGQISGNDFKFNMLVVKEEVEHTGKYYPQGDSIGIDIFFNGDILHSTLLRSNK